MNTLLETIEFIKQLFLTDLDVFFVSIHDFVKCVKRRPTQEEWLKHLDIKEDFAISLTPHLANNQTSWACIDIDFRPAEEKLKEYIKGSPFYLFKSRKKGYHLYIFFTRPYPCSVVRKQLKEWVMVLRQSSMFSTSASKYFPKDNLFQKIELFPSSDAIGPNSSGHAIRIPFHSEKTTIEGFFNNIKKCSIEDVMGRDYLIPPCLEKLTSEQATEGFRNKLCFNIAIYLKRRLGFLDAEILQNYVSKFCDIETSEIETITASLEKQKYQYQCKGDLLNPVCEPKECTTTFGALGYDFEPLRHGGVGVLKPAKVLERKLEFQEKEGLEKKEKKQENLIEQIKNLPKIETKIKKILSDHLAPLGGLQMFKITYDEYLGKLGFALKIKGKLKFFVVKYSVALNFNLLLKTLNFASLEIQNLPIKYIQDNWQVYINLVIRNASEPEDSLKFIIIQAFKDYLINNKNARYKEAEDIRRILRENPFDSLIFYNEETNLIALNKQCCIDIIKERIGIIRVPNFDLRDIINIVLFLEKGAASFDYPNLESYVEINAIHFGTINGLILKSAEKEEDIKDIKEVC